MRPFVRYGSGLDQSAVVDRFPVERCLGRVDEMLRPAWMHVSTVVIRQAASADSVFSGAPPGIPEQRRSPGGHKDR
jgi:hypothetical protein